MSIEQGLFQLVQSDAGIQSLITTTNGQGTYWILAPKQAVFPFVVLSRVATQDTIGYQGDLNFRGTLFQIDSYGSTYYQSRALATAVRDLLKSYRGNLPDADSTAVAGVLQTKDWDLPYEEGGEGFVFRAMQEYRVWYYDAALSVSTPSNSPAVIDGGQS